MRNTFLVLLARLSLLCNGPSFCHCSRILVVPLDGSHWVNMAVIIQELHSRGHSMVVLRSAKSWLIPEKSPYFTSLNIRMLEDDLDKSFYSDMLQKILQHRQLPPFLRAFRQQFELTSMLKFGHRICASSIASMLDDASFMKKLKKAKFDLLLTDPTLPVGCLLGTYLQLPMVFNAFLANTGDSHFTVAPSPPSYVPVPGTEFHDEMDFLERTRNVMHYLYSIFQQYVAINPAYSELLQRHFPPGADLLSMQQSADIWMIRVDFVLEFPRPTMPNVVYIGGLQCKASKPLPAELEAFVQSSGEHGVVVMSLGTYVRSIPKEITEAIAEAFSRLPQKVLWRYEGQRPSNLGNNTLLLDWLPQNDLLGHPKTRAFVAHGGKNGMYEAIYHGVPVLGLPLLFDQYDNLVRLKRHGAAQVVEASSLVTENFLEALKDVLENPSYRAKALRLSQLHRDKPLSPLDTAVFWIEYVIRNKGAAHLRSAGSSLPWYTYHSIDVVVFLLALSVASLWVLVSGGRLLCRPRFRAKRKAE